MNTRMQPALRAILTLIIVLSPFVTLLSVIPARAVGPYNLLASKSSNRSNPLPLDGQVVSGDIYVFTSPDTADITRVRFWLDDPAMNGTPRRNESNAPYDFAGGTVTVASRFDTGTISDGPHVITARIDLSTGNFEVVSANFTVANAGDALVANPAALSLSTTLNGPNASATVDIRTSNGSSMAFTAADNVSWLTVTPTSGNTPRTLTVTANPTGLVAGSYNADITISASGLSPIKIPVAFSIPGPGPDQIHLAWVGDPSTTLTVVWRTQETDVPSNGQIRPQGETTWQEHSGTARTSGTTGKLHEVTFNSLTPATTYEYRVQGPSNSWSAIYETRTAPAAGAADFDFVYVADTGLIGRQDGLTTGTPQVIQEIANLNPLLVLPGGDYAYFDTDKRFGTLNNSIDAWFNQMQPVATRSPLMPTYGNHEALLGENYSDWAARFPTPSGFDQRRNYSFDIGDVHFVSIFAVRGNTALSSGTINWITQDINSAKAAGKRWIIPYFHVAPFAGGTNHPSNLELRAQLGPLFEQLGIKLVLTSHDQSYERTYPLVDVPDTNTPTSTSLSCYTMNDGVTWLKASPGGKLSNISGDFSPWSSSTPPDWTAFRDNTMHHFVRVQVSAAGSLRVEAYGLKGDGSPPVIQDSFEIVDGNCTPTTAPPSPTGLSANAVSDDRINLSWTDNANNESAFIVERSLNQADWTVLTDTLPAGSTSFSDTGLEPDTTYHYRVKATNAVGDSGYSNIASETTSSTGGGGGVPLPGRIEAEDYKAGGEGVGYHDTTPGNNGGQYRTDDVDIQTTQDSSGSFNVGWIDTGEWLAYDVEVAETGSYTFTVRVATPNTGKSFHIEVDGANVTGPVSVPNTGNFQNWTDVTINGVQLTAGSHELRLVMDSTQFNVNFFTVEEEATGGGGIPLPGRIEAEDYKAGGEGVGYHDTTPGNNGGQYRTDDVDIEVTADSSGAFNVGWVEPGEWLAYDVTVASSGSYRFVVRVASPKSGKKFHIEVDGVNVTGSKTVPNTGNFQSWTNVTINGIQLTAGTHELRFVVESMPFNVNYIVVEATP